MPSSIRLLLGRAVAIRDNDSARMKARSLLLVSTLAYSEIGHGASEGYELMVKSPNHHDALIEFCCFRVVLIVWKAKESSSIIRCVNRCT